MWEELGLETRDGIRKKSLKAKGIMGFCIQTQTRLVYCCLLRLEFLRLV